MAEEVRNTDAHGWDDEAGVFRHPSATPYTLGPKPVPGSMDHLEDREYLNGMDVVGRWPDVVRLTHTWQNVIDMNGRRYMYHYYRKALNVYDITDPTERDVILEKRYSEDEGEFGAAAIAYNADLGRWIMVQSFEVPRLYGADAMKYDDPAAMDRLMNAPGFRGFRVFELTSPTTWELLSEVSLDEKDPNRPVQEGSGAVDAPTYLGGRYVALAAAPNNEFLGMEFPTYAYSPIQIIYDISDPRHPRKVSEWWVPGQRNDEPRSRSNWSRYGNHVSWTGARVPMAIPTPIEAGGQYGYAAMGGLGLHILDLSDPSQPQAVGSLELPISVAGIEGDVVDASRAERRGIVLVNGGPMNEDGFEPWKDVYIIDVSDPTNPGIVSTLPRPMPSREAPYPDFALRRGKFGPKRFGSPASPGITDPNLVVYSYGNAGVQLFDTSDVQAPRSVASFVPPMVDDLNNDRSYLVPTESVFVEWDRNLIWAFCNSGMYLLSSPHLGEPKLGPIQS